MKNISLFYSLILAIIILAGCSKQRQPQIIHPNSGPDDSQIADNLGFLRGKTWTIWEWNLNNSPTVGATAGKVNTVTLDITPQDSVIITWKGDSNFIHSDGMKYRVSSRIAGNIQGDTLIVFPTQITQQLYITSRTVIFINAMNGRYKKVRGIVGGLDGYGLTTIIPKNAIGSVNWASFSIN